jgi:D-hexose-6-phosphate mutarotase
MLVPDVPGPVLTSPGRGDLPRLTVSNPAAESEIYLAGAHVTSWAPRGHRPVLWMSENSAFALGLPLRGGVPLCFPWFGPHPSDVAPMHGFARISEWTLLEVVDHGTTTQAVFGLEDTEDTRGSVWPHPFRARYTVSVGAELTLSLTVTNTSQSPLTYAESFHTYFAVSDIRTVVLRGLEGVSFVDRLAGSQTVAPSGEELRFESETERMYIDPGTITLDDPAAKRRLRVTAHGAAHAIVWNPWIDKAAAMADFGDDEWITMVCIETANVLDAAVTLDPGQSHTMAVTIAMEPTT